MQDLLLELFENPGTVFIEEEEFANIAKTHLASSNAVLKNALAMDEDVYIASFQIFIALVKYFRWQLRNEILVLFDQIVLKILESDNSSFMHRYQAL